MNPGGSGFQRYGLLDAKTKTSSSGDEAYSAGRLRIVHAEVPGRVRFRVPGLYRAPGTRRTIERTLTSLPDVRRIHANERTGNLLIVFGPGESVERLARLIAETLGLSETEATTEPRPRPASLAHSLNALASLVRALAARPRQDRTPPRQRASPTGRSEATDWHIMDGMSVLEKLQASAADGLDDREASERLAHFGPNALPRLRSRSGLSILTEQFKSFPVALLGTSAVISLATGGALDAAFILVVVLINAGIGYVTESQAERIIDALSKEAPQPTRVRRDGRDRLIPSEQVVPGDLVPLLPGTRIVADLRLLKTRNLSVDESALTGESMPVVKTSASLEQTDTPLAERVNMAYCGTLVTGGNAVGVVIGTGSDTELGRIQAMVGEARAPETPMQRQLEHIGTQLALLSAAVCVGVFALGLIRGQGALNMLKGAVSLAVAAVPEGLPAVATTTLALGIKTLRKHHVAVRHLDAVETLGSVQVFCLDKTGTLTRNEMCVMAAHTDGRSVSIAGRGFAEAGRSIEPRAIPGLWRLLETIALCNESTLSASAAGTQIEGSPTENALLACARSADMDIGRLRETHPRLKLRHRAEGRPYMQTLHSTPARGRLLAVKGSPGDVLNLCSWRMTNGSVCLLDDEARREILGQNERMAADALRVLGVAYRELDADASPEPGELVWVGLIGMADPLREGMKDLITLYHRAGIETVMITGDQSATAYAIGDTLQLSDDQPLRILESSTLDKVEPDLLAGLVRGVHVFARVSPAHKLQIVQALQRSGKVVAMTGDGINDGPALKAADIGVAMGGSGTDVARSVADVVLEDDNLHTMSTAIQGGRTIYGNIRKTIHFLLATNFTEIEVMLAGIALGMGPPLNPMQLLWINLISDIFPGLALSLEPPEADVLERPPRDPGEPIIRLEHLRRMGLESAIISGGTLLSYTYALMRYGQGPRASTQAFTTLTVGQLLHAISCRSDTSGIFSRASRPPNRRLALALTASLTAQLIIGVVPTLRRLLGTATLGPTDLLVAAAGAIGPLLINEGLKDVPRVVRSDPGFQSSPHNWRRSQEA